LPEETAKRRVQAVGSLFAPGGKHPQFRKWAGRVSPKFLADVAITVKEEQALIVLGPARTAI